jgi:hypothetical protein
MRGKTHFKINSFDNFYLKYHKLAIKNHTGKIIDKQGSGLMNMITISGASFRLENDYIIRQLVFDAGGLHTVSVINKTTGSELIKEAPGMEFMLRLNNKTLFGYKRPVRHILDGNISDRDYNLSFLAAESCGLSNALEQLKLTFQVSELDVKINVYYEINRKFAGISKYLEVISGVDNLSVNSMIFEAVNGCPGRFADSQFYRQSGLARLEAMFALSGSEDVIQIHNPKLSEGMFLGNSAPGTLKYFLGYPEWGDTAICAGYNFEAPPFQKYLMRGQSFTSARSLMLLYQGNAGESKARNLFRDYVRSHLPALPDNGGFMYCSWLPFAKNINESLIFELIDKAAAMGFHSFVLDDGWSIDGYNVDRAKFPNGLEVVARRIHDSGMRFGLWFNVGTNYGNVAENLQFAALKTDGSPKIHGFAGNIVELCFASAHRELAAAKLVKLATQYSVDYFKLDFSSITSPYGIIQAGCASCNHDYHRESGDSVIEQYAGIKYIREQIKAVCPDLIIDFSFEAFGLDHPTIGALEYSELHHISNMNTLNPETNNALRIRNTLYRFATLMPQERLLGSLICLQNCNDIEHVLTALVTNPLVAGDLRKIEGENLERIRRIVLAAKNITDYGLLTEFVKLKGDIYLQPGDWDGFARFNASGHGILCLFRNQSELSDINVQINGLPQDMKMLRFKDILSDDQFETAAATISSGGISKNWFNHDNYCIWTFNPVLQ